MPLSKQAVQVMSEIVPARERVDFWEELVTGQLLPMRPEAATSPVKSTNVISATFFFARCATNRRSSSQESR